MGLVFFFVLLLWFVGRRSCFLVVLLFCLWFGVFFALWLLLFCIVFVALEPEI